MGIIISRFRKKKSALELLEGLEKDIKAIEEYGQTTERQHKAVVGRLLLVSVGLYVMAACLFYFFFFPASLYEQLWYIVPLLLFPLIITFMKRLVSWWYCRKLSRNQDKLSDMKNQKKELLEEVMNKETYKVAKKILEKFAPDQLRKGNATIQISPIVAQENSDANSKQLVLSQRNVVQGVQEIQGLARGTLGTEVRRRHIGINALQSPRPIAAVSAPSLPPSGGTSSGTLVASESTSVTSKLPVAAPIVTDHSEITKASESTSVATATSAAAVAAAPSAGLSNDDNDDDKNEEEEEEDDGVDNDKNVTGKKSSTDAEVADNEREEQEERGPCEGTSLSVPATSLTRPILPKDRSMMDRLVEYLVGDGINQRYALICHSCHSHNGMALKEEFEYIAFRCCYCFHWNPARKQRLQAPRLEVLPSSGNTTTSSSAPESNTDDEDSPDVPARAVPPHDVQEIKSEPRPHLISTSSSDEDRAANAETAESPSSTEAEFESLLPDPPSSTRTVNPDALSH